MPVNSAAELVKAIADQAINKHMPPSELAQRTGIDERRLNLLFNGDWETLRIREIAHIMEALELDQDVL